jgi:DNA-binding NarL/FixJ family response regulator
VRRGGPSFRLRGRRPPASPWDERLTERQRAIVAALRAGEAPAAVAARLGMRLDSVRKAVARLAAHLPGDLPAQARVTVWARGGEVALRAVCAVAPPPEPPND